MRAPFLALVAIVSAASAQTVLVKPYVQPGNPPADQDVKVLTWITDQKPGTFTVEYGWKGIAALKTAAPERTTMDFAKTKKVPKKSETEEKPKSPLANAATTVEELNDAIIETFKPLQEREQHFFRYR